MESFNYTNYSLEHLQEWVHDAINTDATPEQIVDAIIKALQENVNYHTEQLNKNAHAIALLKNSKV